MSTRRLGGQHDDRHAARLRAGRLQTSRPFYLRQHEVEDDKSTRPAGSARAPPRRRGPARPGTVPLERVRRSFLTRRPRRRRAGWSKSRASRPVCLHDAGFSPPYYSPAWRRTRLRRARARAGLARAPDQRPPRTAEPGCSSGFRCSSPLSASASRPALRAAVPTLPPAFDRPARSRWLADLAQTFPDRSPGSPGAASARQWFADQVANFGFHVRRESFTADDPGTGPRPAREPDRHHPRALAAGARRHGAPRRYRYGPGANDNASGSPRWSSSLARTRLGLGERPLPERRSSAPRTRSFFVATDGGEFGGLGAQRFATDFRDRLVTAIVLDTIAGKAPSRLVIAGDTAQEPRRRAGRDCGGENPGASRRAAAAPEQLRSAARSRVSVHALRAGAPCSPTASGH